ncbi:MAG: permease-like cell division protein FtsX [Candidatus Pacebacteria bacterium]|nr:permease-like cell division protein FtsX [Candidatus Paceibacterota bacterium]
MSLRLDIQRILREGLINFWRNKLVSFSTIMVMTMAMVVMSSLLFMNAVLDFSLVQLQDRVDVNIYFFPDVPETEILTLQSKLQLVPEIRDVQYISREQAFLDFQERHRNDDLITRSLEELGDNPLGASLNIRAFESTQYEAVIAAIESEPVVTNSDFVERINYYDNKTIIERLNQFTGVVRLIGYAVVVFFSVVALLVILSTMRIAIFAAKKEIRIKRLVGAEHRYVRGPFLVMGGMYGLVSAILTMLVLYPMTRWIGNYTSSFFGGMDIASYYAGNILPIFIILVTVGMLIGIISSRIATKKYLKI